MKSFLSIILVAILSGMFGFSLYKNYLNYQNKQKYVQEAKRELERELDRKKKLVSEHAKAQDYSEIEYIIREKLNLTKPGEYVYIIDRPTPTQTPTPTPYYTPLQQWVRLLWQ